jgi:DNA-binding NarL/FixJ family response regulator
MVVVGEAENGEEAVSLSRELNPDVVVMNLMMPVLSGSEATRLITAGDSAENKKPRVLIFTSYGTSADLARAVINGATGVLPKSAPTHDLHIFTA